MCTVSCWHKICLEERVLQGFTWGQHILQVRHKVGKHYQEGARMTAARGARWFHCVLAHLGEASWLGIFLGTGRRRNSSSVSWGENVPCLEWFHGTSYFSPSSGCALSAYSGSPWRLQKRRVLAREQTVMIEGATPQFAHQGLLRSRTFSVFLVLPGFLVPEACWEYTLRLQTRALFILSDYCFPMTNNFKDSKLSIIW